jgi:hypothetical protein
MGKNGGHLGNNCGHMAISRVLHYGGHMGKNGGHIGKYGRQMENYGGHMGNYGGHMGISRVMYFRTYIMGK